MAGSDTDPARQHIAVRRRPVEIGIAAVLAAAGVLIATGSLIHDIGWNESGPGAGYFPFRVGILLGISAIVLLVGAVRVPVPTIFATHEELLRALAVFWPTAVLVGLIPVLGAYAASAVYLLWMMRRHGGYGWLPSAAFSAAAMAVFYLVFDVWFRLPLPKGLLGA
jgi:putative tricarboxylic transport membrane protein